MGRRIIRPRHKPTSQVIDSKQNNGTASASRTKPFRFSLSHLASRIPSRSRSAYICSRLLYKSMPASVRTGIVASLGRSWPFFCPACENRVPGFSPLPEFYFQEMELHGSDLRITDFETCNFKAYQCPHCGATDRDRMYALYLASRLPAEPSRQASFSLLEIAPARPLSAFIRRKFNLQYRTADRFMKNVDDCVDITSMSGYADDSFDAFICSHVLEHVDNDQKAMAELYRVLKPGGWGIAMAPINLALAENREDASKTTVEERWKWFGQGDHVRVYSREGFIGRLQEAGFIVRQFGPDHFKSAGITRCGITDSSVLYVVEKPAPSSFSACPHDDVAPSLNYVLVRKDSLKDSRDAKLPRLAITGAPPRFSEQLHVGRPNIGDKARLMERIEEIIDSRWLTNDGPVVHEFENKIRDITGAKHCISMCNATVALEIAIRALELRGEVIIPSYTFVATAHALQWQEITPVFADIDPTTLNLDPGCLERLITPRTTGIIGVHVWGRPCDTNAIGKVARKHNLKVMYDAAHAFGCSHEGRMVGNFGECEVFSFHATKFINSFEGGAIVTNNDALAKKIRLMRNFGFAGFDRVVYLGTNGKMTEVCAAMGLTSVESMGEIIRVNRENYDEYKTRLLGINGVKLIDYASNEKRNYHYIVIEVDASRSPLNRDELVQVLHSENVLARKYFWPGCHRMEPYKSLFPNAYLLLPNTEFQSAQVMVLPTGQCVTKSDIAAICDIIRSAISQAPLVQRVLRHNGRELARNVFHEH
jgi:dTDP-4-amino-4,6-dideoxygalactose transaminase/SAM-dependent methyltransferase